MVQLLELDLKLDPNPPRTELPAFTGVPVDLLWATILLYPGLDEA